MIPLRQSQVLSPRWQVGGKASEEGWLGLVDGRCEPNAVPLKTIHHCHIRHDVQWLSLF